jgi:hypothetical protein
MERHNDWCNSRSQALKIMTPILSHVLKSTRLQLGACCGSLAPASNQSRMMTLITALQWFLWQKSLVGAVLSYPNGKILSEDPRRQHCCDDNGDGSI